MNEKNQEKCKFLVIEGTDFICQFSKKTIPNTAFCKYCNERVIEKCQKLKQ